MNTPNISVIKTGLGTPDPSYPEWVEDVNGSIYFTASDAMNVRKLWKVDSSGNAVVVKDSGRKNNVNTFPEHLTINGTLYFTVLDYVTNPLWKIDSSGNAVLVNDTNSNRAVSSPQDLTNVNGTLYFTADDTNGRELWKIDSSGNAVLAKDINSGSASSYPANLTNVNGILYFSASDVRNGQELWKIDSSGNAALVKDINPGIAGTYLASLTNVNGTLYFTADDTNGTELWKIDSNGNAVLVKDINPGGGSSSPTYLTNVNGTLYFTADDDSTNRRELWKVDSSGNAVLVKDINPSGDFLAPMGLTNVNGTLYFDAYDSVHGYELWKIDSSGNAVLVKDTVPGSNGSQPHNLTNVNGTLYFTGNDNTNTGYRRLLMSDGTTAGTQYVSGGSYLSPINLTSINNKLFFHAIAPTFDSFALFQLTPTNTGTTITDFKKDPAKYMGAIRDYDGNDLGGSSTWKSIGEVDINRDGTVESILVNPKIERFASVGSVGGNVDFTKYGLNGDTRVVGIYIDPTLANSPEKRGGPFDSQRRFQNDLKIDNLTVLAAGDYNNDGFQDLYFKLGDGTATLRALMHADGNINYANYQSKSDLAAFMTANNVNNSVWGSWL